MGGFHRFGLLPLAAGGFPVGFPTYGGGMGLQLFLLTGGFGLFQPQGGGFGLQLPDGFLALQQVFEGHRGFSFV